MPPIVAANTLRPNVLDIYHGDTVEGQADGSYSGFAKLKAAGYLAVILKATQGVQSHDPEYAKRRVAALAAGLAVGAYDFNTGDPVDQQVAFAMKIAQPTADSFFALDFEDNSASEMSLAQMLQYLQLADTALTQIAGREKLCAIYSGNRIKELIRGADQNSRNFLSRRKFWLCEYGAQARMTDADGHPLPWANWWLWQRDADGFGPDFHNAPGITTPNIDQNVYAGTPEQLALDWAA